jgi:hypothetical protein
LVSFMADWERSWCWRERQILLKIPAMAAAFLVEVKFSI